MNQNVLAGGSSAISFSAGEIITKALVGIQGVNGYYEIIPTQLRDGYYEIVLIMSQELTEESFIIQLAYIAADGSISQTETIEIALVTAGTGQLQISLSFNNEKDVDLHLIEPNGDHIYYGNRISANGGSLDVDSNPGCSIDGINLENIFYSNDAYVEPGLYMVYVDMYMNCDNTIPTSYVLSVFYNGDLIQTTTGANPSANVFPINTPNNYGALSDIEPVITFVIPDTNAKKPTKKFDKAPLSESAKLKLSMKK